MYFSGILCTLCILKTSNFLQMYKNPQYNINKRNINFYCWDLKIIAPFLRSCTFRRVKFENGSFETSNPLLRKLWLHKNEHL